MDITMMQVLKVDIQLIKDSCKEDMASPSASRTRVGF